MIRFDRTETASGLELNQCLLKDGNGFISSAELRHLLTTLGEKLSDEEAEQLLMGHEDNKGNINYENFVRSVMNG